jgi:hypothetical protein
MRATRRLLAAIIVLGLLAGGAWHFWWRNRPLTTKEVQRIFGRFQYRESQSQRGRIVIDPAWVRANIVTRQLPIVGSVRCHRLIADQLHDVFAEIERQGLAPLIDVADWRGPGGCFVPRHMMWNPRRALSRHSWGIAIDINTSTNRYGTRGKMDPRIVAIFERHGFRWGGRWRPPDPMHFEAVKIVSSE